MSDSKAIQKKRVCIIGAGPSGMSLLNAFMYAQMQGTHIPELVCFEKQAEMGGLWNDSWATSGGVQEYGSQIHESMYRYQLSNQGPKECLEMADYTFDEHFKKAIPSYPPRLALRDYLLGKAKKYGIERFIRTSHMIQNVEERKDGRLSVTYENLKERQSGSEIFDYVIVATGHFSVPKIPEYPGIDTFPGDVLHARDFKNPSKYQNKRVVLVGSGYSAEDAALQLYKYGAKEIIISYRTAPMGFKWPSNIKEWPLLTNVDGSFVQFRNGRSYEADAIIFCTGYQHHFPFMSDSLRLQAGNLLYPNHLYKGVIFNNSTKVCYLGMQDQWFTFTMFDAEAWYVRDYILGKIEIPDKLQREEDIRKWHTRCLNNASVYDAIDFQRDFIADLHTVSIISDFMGVCMCGGVCTVIAFTRHHIKATEVKTNVYSS